MQVKDVRVGTRDSSQDRPGEARDGWTADSGGEWSVHTRSLNRSGNVYRQTQEIVSIGKNIIILILEKRYLREKDRRRRWVREQ